jgi:DNA mismatch repair protein MutS
MASIGERLTIEGGWLKMAAFTSILDPQAGNMTGAATPPDCLAGLHLGQIIAEVTAGCGDSDLAGIFYTPLHNLSTVEYRQRVFCDLDNDEIRSPIKNFVDGMRTMRGRLHVTRNVWHPLQQQGWLLAAIESYCHTVATLRHDLAHNQPRSRGLRDFADHVARYIGGEPFRRLVAETEAMLEQLHKIRYLVHIEGLRVHLDKFDDQSDYSAKVAEAFARFATEVAGA